MKKTTTLQSLKKQYDRLEENNDCDGAAQLLVDNFGTESAQQIIRDITARHEKLGYITNEDRTLRYETSNKYYKLLIKL